MVATHSDRAPDGAQPVLDGPAVRRWADAALAAMLAARAEIDALNVYPVPDSDTGSNLVNTLQAGVEQLRALAPGGAGDRLAVVSDTLATALLRGACGNSGTILSQLLRGVADAARDADQLDGAGVAAALARAARLARAGLARPVEGTILTVADAAAAAASAAADAGAGLVRVLEAARSAAEAALADTPAQLAALQGRVDAGGRGLVVLLAALETAVAGADQLPPDQRTRAADVDPPTELPAGIAEGAERPPAPAHEVMYLLDTDVDAEADVDRDPGTDGGGEAARVAELRWALDRLGDSVVVVGGNGLWQVHAHVDDVGAAVEAGFAAGRPHRVRITALDVARPGSPARSQSDRDPAGLGVVAVVDGPGLASVLTAAGGLVLDPEHLAAGLAAAPDDLGTRLVAVLPGSPETLLEATRRAAADPRLRVVRTRAAVQVIAALAVHDPARDPDLDLLEMSTAAAGCRHGLVEVAEGEGVTSAGRCRAGDVLGHVHGDVAIIGADLAEVGVQVVELLLGGGGELVTLVTGAPAPPDLAARVSAAVRARRPDVDVTVYDGGQPSSYLLVGVE